MIKCPLARQSKFGPPIGKTGKEYKLVELNERELEKVMSESTKQEIQALRQIKKDKELVKQEVFFEDIYTFPIEMNAKKERENRKRKNFEIGK
jgi:predicted nucleic acid-binding protein